ncbi:MAG: NUDIX domain-containing protein [Vicinamibacterales bacterium]
MAISRYYRALRERVGPELLLIPAVSALVRDAEGRLLVHQRPDGTWSLPAGAIEPGETPAQAVVRETLEETGLLVVPERVAAVVGGESCRVRNRDGHEIEYLVTVFECWISGGTLLHTSDETVAVMFVPPEDAMTRVVFRLPDDVYQPGRGTTYFQADES